MSSLPINFFKAYFTNQIVPLGILLGGKQIAVKQQFARKRILCDDLTSCIAHKALGQELDQVLADAWDTLGLVSAFLAGPGGALAKKDFEFASQVDESLANCLFQVTTLVGALSADDSYGDLRRSVVNLSSWLAKVQKAIFYTPARRGLWISLLADPRLYVSHGGKISRWRKLLTFNNESRQSGMVLAEMHGVLPQATQFYDRLIGARLLFDVQRLYQTVDYSDEALQTLKDALEDLAKPAYMPVARRTVSVLEHKASLDELRAMLGYFGERPQEAVEHAVKARVEASQETPVEPQVESPGQASASADTLKVHVDDFAPELPAQQEETATSAAQPEPAELEDYEFVVYLEEALTPQELERYVLLPEFTAFSQEAASAKLTLTNRNAMGPELCDSIAAQWVEMRKDYLRATAIPALDVAYAKATAVREARLTQALTSVNQAVEGLSPKDKDELLKALVAKLTA